MEFVEVVRREVGVVLAGLPRRHLLVGPLLRLLVEGQAQQIEGHRRRRGRHPVREHGEAQHRHVLGPGVRDKGELPRVGGDRRDNLDPALKEQKIACPNF